jgi:hypothetical protein
MQDVVTSGAPRQTAGKCYCLMAMPDNTALGEGRDSLSGSCSFYNMHRL